MPRRKPFSAESFVKDRHPKAMIGLRITPFWTTLGVPGHCYGFDVLGADVIIPATENDPEWPLAKSEVEAWAEAARRCKMLGCEPKPRQEVILTGAIVEGAPVKMFSGFAWNKGKDDD